MRPFRIEIPREVLDDLARRLSATRWPAELPDVGWERGVPLTYLQELAEYWQNTYDWRAAEARLNQFPQYVTEIDGTNVHFVHARSPEPDALPLVLTHGWPGSHAEFIDIVRPLTDPRSCGGNPADAFHVVIPSLPGHGFSGPTSDTGWNYQRVARAWVELMDRLGYERYLAQGGDHGAFVSLDVARLVPDRVAGVHVNMVLVAPSGDPAELAAMTEVDNRRLADMAAFDAERSAYMKLHATRPYTVSYGLTDSPVGQLAWIAEKFKEFSDSVVLPEEAVDRDAMLTNIMIYWLTGTAATSAQMFYEARDQMRGIFAGVTPDPVKVPIAVATFLHDLAPVRRLAERDYPTICQWHEFERGGHFPSMEQPELFVEDIRTFARSVR